MAKVDGDSRNSDKLRSQPDESAPAEPAGPEIEEGTAGDMFGQSDAEDETAGAPLEEPIEGEQAEAESLAEEEEAGAESEEPPLEIPPSLEWAGVIGVPVIVLAIAAVCAIFFTTALSAFSWAIYLIALGFIPYGLWKGRETNTVYTLVLGCALAALLTMTFSMWRNWRNTSSTSRPAAKLACRRTCPSVPPSPRPSPVRTPSGVNWGRRRLRQEHRRADVRLTSDGASLRQ